MDTQKKITLQEAREYASTLAGNLEKCYAIISLLEADEEVYSSKIFAGALSAVSSILMSSDVILDTLNNFISRQKETICNI